MKTLRIGTRQSLLALAQSRLIADVIRTHHPEIETELVKIVTTGDLTSGPLVAVGGKGQFTAHLESAMRDGSVDLAVHSAKDVPTALDKEFTIAAVPERVDPRDALVSRYGVDLSLLRMGARVGTGSLRRAAQLRYVREDLEIVPMRGNVDTRLHKVMADTDDAPDAVVLAMAGLIRTGLVDKHADCIRPLEDMIPAAGQGALVIETLADNDAVARLLEPLNHAPSHEALLTERAVLAGLHADCHSCVAVHVRQAGSLWFALAMAARPGGQDVIQVDLTGACAAGAGQDLLKSLLEKGADTLIADRHGR